MKKIFTLAASALMASAAWAGVITLDLNANVNPATIEYGDNGVWTECYNDVDYAWLEFGDANGMFYLSHLLERESWGGYYWDGFTPPSVVTRRIMASRAAVMAGLSIMAAAWPVAVASSMPTAQ